MGKKPTLWIECFPTEVYATLRVITTSARTSHTQSTAAAEMAPSMAFRSVGLLNVPYSAFAGAFRRAPCIHSHLHCLATIRCEKCGPSPPLNVRLNCSLVPLQRAGGICSCQRGASSFPILANSDLRSWTGPATTSTECSGETYFRTAFWKVSGVTRSRRNP